MPTTALHPPNAVKFPNNKEWLLKKKPCLQPKEALFANPPKTRRRTSLLRQRNDAD